MFILFTLCSGQLLLCLTTLALIQENILLNSVSKNGTAIFLVIPTSLVISRVETWRKLGYSESSIRISEQGRWKTALQIHSVSKFWDVGLGILGAMPLVFFIYCTTKCYKPKHIKRAHVYYFRGPVVHESGHKFSGSHLTAIIKVSVSALVSSLVQMGKKPFPSLYGCCRTWVIVAYRIGVLVCWLLLARGHLLLLPGCWPRLPSIPWHMRLPNMSPDFTQASKGKYANKKDVTVLCNIISDVTSHHLCHSLIFRSRSQVLPTFKGRLYKVMSVQKLV